MALLRRNKEIKSTDNSGFGTSVSGRFVNKNGTANVKHVGVNILRRYSWYHMMLEMSAARFIILLLCFYVVVNIVFALIYYMIGIEHISGIDRGTHLQNFMELFFFSAQTFTTVGYGRISPVGFLPSFVATIEAFLGLMVFAIATGLFYGRFSRPRAFLKFSEKALIAPHRGKTALMFRMAPYKNNNLSNGEVFMSAAFEYNEDGETKNYFYVLQPEIAKINSLSLNWTIVHLIDEDSPFWGLSEEDIKNADIEILVYIKAFDEVFANEVVQRTSYYNDEIVYGAKFKPMYYPSQDGQHTILDLDLLNSFAKVPINVVEEK